MTRLIWLEIKKLIFSRTLLGFMIICLAFNALVVFENGKNEYSGYVAGVSESAGVVLDDSFSQRLALLPQSENRQRLAAETAEPQNVFDGYDTGAIAQVYINSLHLKDGVAEDMRDKYAKLQQAADEKAERGDSLTVYFAGETYREHNKLFGVVLFALSIEGMMIAVLAMLLALDHERINKTEQIVYSTKTGRRIVSKKGIAAVIFGLSSYLLLTAMTLALYFAVNDYGDVWGSSVSSGFNGIVDLLTGFRPFLTRRSFTVSAYLFATIGVSLGLVLCLSLAGFAVGTSIRNSYIGFLVVLLAGALCIALPNLLPVNSHIRYAFILTPVWLWLKQPLWFTDGSYDVLWSDFELRGIVISLTFVVAIGVIAAARFKRRDIA